MPEVTFVGRKEYIKRFRQLLDDHVGSSYILNLYGGGGYGKTKILHEFEKICIDERIPCTGIIDFYDTELKSQINVVELTIAKALSAPLTLAQGPFAKYWRVRQEAEEARQKHEVRYGVLRERSKNQFIADLALWAETAAAEGTGGVLIFDTFEEVKDNQVGARLVKEWLRALKPVTVIISGRQEEGPIAFPPEINDLVIPVEVEAFDEAEATAYLEVREVWAEIVQDNADQDLFRLTQLQPLRLALSADRIKGDNFPERITPAELVAGTNEADFERKLVKNLADDMLYPESLVLPIMAHIPRPFDAELINFLFPDSFDDPETILKNLSKLSFVKEIKEGGQSRYWFQDELRRLFRKYVFEIDSFTWNTRRREASEQMLAFYDAQIKAAEKAGSVRLKEQLIADRLYYEIYLDPQQGFDKAEQEFQDAREAYTIGFANTILGAVRSAVDFLDEDQRFRLSLMRARSLRDNEYIESSKQALETLKEKFEADPERAVFIYNALGGSTEKLGELGNALSHYSKALELSERLERNERLSLEHINIGRVHQSLGNLDQAIEHFRRAYELSMVYNLKQHTDRIARSLSELGYTYGLVGERQAGLDYCNEAIDAWKLSKNKSAAARSRVLRGAVYWMASNYDQAITDITEALKDFTVRDHQFRAEAYLHLGVAQWLKSIETEGDIQLLKTAQESLETSISIAEESGNEHWPKALNQISNIYWLQGQKDKAREVNDKAYFLAKDRFHDVNYTIDCLLGKAEFDYEDSNYETVPAYADQLKKDFEVKGYKYPLFYGRMRRILGDIAFKQGRYDEASNYYAEGLPMIAEHGGYGIYSIQQERENLAKKLHQISPATALDVCLNLKAAWLKKGLDGQDPQMISWVDRLIGRFTFQAQSK
jgi:tetratricopeptide (TPR) repeat protein